MKFNKKLILGILILIFLFICFCKFRTHKKELFNQQCNFKNDICKPLTLLDVNFIINTVDSNNNENKDKPTNKNKFYTFDNKYYGLIEYNQPFNYGPNHLNTRDQVIELKQSQNFIWCLNSARNQIKKAHKRDINNKIFTNTFLEDDIDRPDFNSEEPKFIKAFGVTQEGNDEWCIINVKDFNNDSKSVLYFFKADDSVYIDMFNDPDINVSKYYKVDLNNLELYGDIHIEKKDNELKLYCIGSNINNNNIKKCYLFEIKILLLDLNDGTSQISIQKIFETNDYQSYNDRNDNDSDFYKIMLHIKKKIEKNYIDNSIDLSEIKEILNNNNNNNNNITKILDEINIRDTNSDLNIVTSVRNLLNKCSSNNECKSNDSENVIPQFIFELNKLINLSVIKKIKYNITDFKIINDDFYIYKTSLSDSNIREIKLSKKYIDEYIIKNSSLPINLNELFDTSNNINDILKPLTIETKIGEENIVSGFEITNTLSFGYESNEFDNNFNNIKNTLNEIKFREIEFKNEKVLENINRLKIIHAKNELIRDVRRKPDLNNFYIKNIDIKYSFSVNNNIMGFMDLDMEKYKDEKSPIKKANIVHPRRVLFTLFRKIEKDDEFKGDRVKYGRINKNFLVVPKSMAISSFKYNYKSYRNDNKKKSLLYYFYEQQINNVFTDLTDWVYLYSIFKDVGFYYPNKLPNKFRLNYNDVRSSILNDEYIMGNEKFTEKHEKILSAPEFKNVYDDNRELKKIMNIKVFIEPGHDNIKEKDRFNYLQINYEKNSSNNKYDGNFIGLSRFDTDSGRPEIQNKKNYNNKEYGYFNLKTISNSQFVQLDDFDEKLKYKWVVLTINSFNDFANIVLGSNKKNESYSRDRLRGIYEIDDIYVDDEYISFLEGIKKKNFKNSVTLNDFEKKIEEKKEIRDKKCVYNKENKMINKIGYPFRVIYKYIDYYGKPCLLNSNKYNQRLFLTNKLTDSHFEITNYNKQYDEGDDKKNFEKTYPFIKEEFLSFTGYGNAIQFYTSEFGGSTNISTSNVGNCYDQVFSYTDDCNDNKCNQLVLSYINTDGSARCEIDNPNVKRNDASPVETLLIGSVNINACNVWMEKGDIKIYYKLGKVFRNTNGIKYQIPNVFTIQTTEKGLENQYLKYNNGKIELDINPLDDNQEIKREYRFIATMENDIYGVYFLFSPDSQPRKFITQKINIFDHKLSTWLLESKIEKDDRNKEFNHYKKDIESYSQKFNLPESLQRNVAANDGISNEASNEDIKEFIKTQSVLNSLGLNSLTRGDTEFSTIVSLEEEKRILERELGYLNDYLRNINKVPPQEITNIDELKNRLRQHTQEIKNRKYIGEERIKNIKFIIQATEDAKRQESSLRPDENLAKMVKNTENNLNIDGISEIKSNINIDSNKMNRNNQYAKFVNNQKNDAFKQIKNSFPTREKEQPKCYNVMESFSNMKIADHYQPLTRDKKGLDNHVVDHYYEYIKKKLNKTEERVKNKNDIVSKKLDNIANIAKAVKLDSNQKQILLSEEIENRNKLDRDIFKIKNYEQENRIKNIESKINEIKNLQYEMGESSFNNNNLENSQYQSILSHEDGELLNIYKINKNELNDYSPSISPDMSDIISPSVSNLEEEELNKNMILINGGCLSYDEKNKIIDVNHCMINDNKQHFNIHRIDDINDMKNFNLKNYNKGMDKPFNIVSRVKKDVLGENNNLNNNNLKNNLCLHKNDDNQISFQNCDNIKNQKWSHSRVSGSCNK